MDIRRIGPKHFQFIRTSSDENRISPERETVEAEIQTHAYRLWLKRDVGKGSRELDWLIDGRLMHDLARLPYPKLLRIDRLLAKKLAETTGPRISPADDPSPYMKQRGALILVVDDDPAVRDFIRYALEEHGYPALTAPDAESALRLLDAHEMQVELIISDVQMPGMSGDALAECIRQEHPKMRILLMSGMAAEEIPEHWGGAIIHKPFQLDHMLACVQEALHVTVH